MKKIITWVDLQGRYRVTSPAYDDLARLQDFSEDDAINWTWTNIVESQKYGITYGHPVFLVEDTAQRERLKECCGTYFRYVGMPDANGKRSAVGGAWEMDTDGRPKVNMPKARLIQMDRIRQIRNKALKALDVPWMRAIETGDNLAASEIAAIKQTLRDIPETFKLSGYRTAATLKAAWPPILPKPAEPNP